MRLTRIAALALIPALAFLACARQGEEAARQQMEMATSVDMEALATALDQITTASHQAWEAGDAAAMAALFTDDAMVLPPEAPAIQGRAPLEEWERQLIAQTTLRHMTSTRTALGASGDIAWDVGTYSLSIQLAGQTQAMQQEGKYLTVYKRQAGGTWKVHVDIWNTNAPATQPGATQQEM